MAFGLSPIIRKNSIDDLALSLSLSGYLSHWLPAGQKPGFFPKEKPDKDSRWKPIPIPGLGDKHPLANQGNHGKLVTMVTIESW